MEEKKIGEFIRKLREEKGWTQDELASKLYISRQIISNIELGKMLPSHDKVVKLSKIFEVNILDIYSGEIVQEISSKETSRIISYIELCLNSKIKKFVVLSVLLFFLLLISFCFYYFLYTYNSVKIYQIYGDGKDYRTDKGLMVLTKENIYFKLNILSNSDDEINFINLKLKNEKSDKLIMRTDDTEIFIVDFYGYNSYFNYNSFIKGEEKLYLEIESANEEVEIIDLILEKNYENDSLLYGKASQEIINHKSQTITDDIPEIVQKSFYKEGEYYKLKVDNKTIITYSTDTHIFNVEKENKNNFEIWDFDFDLKTVNYSKLDKEWNIIDERENMNMYEDDEKISYFINNYYDKYLK